MVLYSGADLRQEESKDIVYVVGKYQSHFATQEDRRTIGKICFMILQEILFQRKYFEFWSRYVTQNVKSHELYRYYYVETMNFNDVFIRTAHLVIRVVWKLGTKARVNFYKLCCSDE